MPFVELADGGMQGVVSSGSPSRTRGTPRRRHCCGRRRPSWATWPAPTCGPGAPNCSATR
ncbi:hypothetical protein DQ392_07800 [Streptomyces reniochalinae]|uniref:Uncharacterized protein n=1 Tax=Streptomyces reniochalinae TaxID=2250578 RepID=A0A367EV98_9ACTN|nr:hypothetical protein DQ392_07800 [Streptomyces reniochalinae]